MWAPFALPIYTWVKDPNLVNLLTLPVLYIEFIILIRLWGQHIYRQPNLLQRYGLEITPQMGWLVLAGLIPGTALVFIIFGLLERDYSPRVALWVSSLIFALVHFIKPWEVIQRMWFALPALLFLGVALVWAKRSTRSVKKAQRHLLGLPIGLHTGLVWGYYVISVGQLVSYNNTVPEWITGIDRNPLSGVLGCVSMGAIALMLRRSATRNSLQSRSH
jgi:uncharacterized protein